MDTMDATKIVGGLCGALLIFLLVNWAADILYRLDGAGGNGINHIAKVRMPADIYSTHTNVEEPTVVEAVLLIEDLLVNADAIKGERVFNKCKACHKVKSATNGVGPHLDDLIDREIASVDGFSYSLSLRSLAGAWDLSALDQFLSNPKKYAKGTKMSFVGLKKAQDRANVIKYLQKFDD